MNNLNKLDNFTKILLVHFNYDQSNENLKCENCLHFKLDECRGKSYKHKKVKECMKEHAKTSFIDGFMTNMFV